MSVITKTYFLCPPSEFIHPPPIGPLCLGSIIRSPSTPQYPLNRANTVAVQANNTNPPVVETDWKKTISTETGFGFGVYAHFSHLAAAAVPFGPEVDIERSKKTSSTFAFDTVTTTAFDPSPAYVDEAVRAPGVQAWLREPRQRFAPGGAALFLVTGLKIVKGARMRFVVGARKAVSADVGVEGVVGPGVSLGSKGRWVRVRDEETAFDREAEFVFAFRVKRLRFGRRLKVDEYSKGAFLAVGGERGEEEEEDGDDGGVLVEDVDGSEIRTAQVVPDVAENGNVYCVPA